MTRQREFVPAAEYAMRIHWSRERVIRAIISGIIAGEKDPQTGHWMVSAHELEDRRITELTRTLIGDTVGLQLNN